MSDNPLTTLLKGQLSEHDFGVLEHGFAPHGRDYRFLIEDSLCSDPGTYELILTHVVDLKYETRVGEKIWAIFGQMNSRTMQHGRLLVSLKDTFLAQTGHLHIPELAFCSTAPRHGIGRIVFSVQCMRLALRLTVFVFL